jgi:brefeldin A-resistance guanine nucleotide exchange factor 1
LESFRIPGEAPIIARILEAFAKNYFALVKEPFANADAAYILAYSVVMLNVDQHNPQVTHRMTEQEFIRNNRGINDKKDLPQEMLKDIYYSIKNYEMKIPEEQLGLDIHNSWRHILNRSKIIGEFKTYQTGNYDQDLFAVIWGPLIAAISVGNYCSLHIQLTYPNLVYDTADDDSILSKATEGFNLCAKISAYYELTDVLDNLMVHNKQVNHNLLDFFVQILFITFTIWWFCCCYTFWKKQESTTRHKDCVFHRKSSL